MARKILVRWLVRSDMSRVIECEKSRASLNAEDMWIEDEWLELLRHKTCLGLVAVDEKTGFVLGAVLYRLLKSEMNILRLIVDEEEGRQGVGSALVGTLKDKMTTKRDAFGKAIRERMRIWVPRDSACISRFLSKMGFRRLCAHGDYEQFEYRVGAVSNIEPPRLGADFDWHAIADGVATVFEPGIDQLKGK